MMVVITLSKCPPKLRGDLTKWLIEIDTGVFVGNLNARVRDSVWNRICENIKNGRASMAFSTNGEQKLDFRIHNTEWEPVDFDGIKLVRHNFQNSDDTEYKKSSKTAVNHITRLEQIKKKPAEYSRYIAIDIETTGLNDSDRIIEIGAVLIENGKKVKTFSTFVKCDIPIPDGVSSLTGITEDDLAKNGIPLKDAMQQFVDFCGNDTLVGHNINFDMRFIQTACKNSGIPIIKNRLADTMGLAKKKLKDIQRYSLSAIAEYFGIKDTVEHRALSDCLLTYRIFEKLNEI